MTTTSSGDAARDVGPLALALPFAPESASVARHRLRDWLDAIGTGFEQLDDARLLVSELVGNAVRHARPLADDTLQVAFGRSESTVDIAVTDGGSVTAPERVDASLSALSGRGLSIVESLASSWWVESTRSRTTVHAVLSVG